MKKRKEKQPEAAVRALLDPNAKDDWDDIAKDLAAYDEPDVEAVLARLAIAPTTDPDLAETCAESLATIWSRRGGFDSDILRRLPSTARRAAIGTMKALKPEWAKSLQNIMDDQPDA